MGFWREEVADPALDDQTRRAIEEQRGAIAAEPANPRPYYNLALLYRMQGKQDEAVALLLEAVRLDATFAPAHVGLAEIYAIRDDPAAARRHADLAAAQGDPRAREMLQRWNQVE
jgi:tetratricopeptide (TPR) repeat protein